MASLIELDIPAQPAREPSPELPSPADTLLDPLLKLTLKPNSVAAAPLQPPSSDLLALTADDPTVLKNSLESELMDSDFAHRAAAEREAREQHKKAQLEVEHMRRIYASGFLPAAGAVSASPGGSPFMSSSAIPSVFVAQVPGPDGNMVPMMFTGLTLAMPGAMTSESVLPGLPAATMPKPEVVPMMKRDPDSVAVPIKEDTNANRFDFINLALHDAKGK